MNEVLIPEGQIREHLGLRVIRPVDVGQGPKINLHRFNLNGTIYLRRSDILALLRAESHQLGGDPVLDKLANTILEVTS